MKIEKEKMEGAKMIIGEGIRREKRRKKKGGATREKEEATWKG